LARKEGGRYSKKRLLYQTLHEFSGKHFTGIVGPRGAGKTILLKQLLVANDNAFYISLDTVIDGDLFDIAKRLQQVLGIEILLLDEIHFQKKYDGELKKIYDFLDLKVIFTSSVALAISESVFDLSRRVRIIKLPLFSFREYIFFTEDVLLPVLSLKDIIEKRCTTDYIRYGYRFNDYLSGGLLPFSLEDPDPLPLLENVLIKILQRDIPSIASILVEEIGLIEKVVRFIGKSTVDGINYSTISKNIGITKYKAASYLDLLVRALVLHVVFPKGTNVMREPKVLFCPPYRLLFNDYDLAIGGLREDFFAEMLTGAMIDFYYLKSTRGTKTPDFLIRCNEGNIVLEVGGKGKGRSQFKGIRVDRKIIFAHSEEIDEIRRPLFLLGYLY